jgi:hypothetical protein
MIASRRALISSSLQKKLEKSCTHSKYDTVTPPALASTSGTTRIPLLTQDIVGGRQGRTVGALDHDPGTQARSARDSVSCPSRAAGTRNSHSVCQNSSFVIALAPAKPAKLP